MARADQSSRKRAQHHTPITANPTRYTLIIHGSPASFLIRDNTARLRVVHASPDAPNVDVLANDTAVLTNVPFKAASDYLEVDPGDYVFKLNAAGTSTTAFTSPTLSLDGGKVYTAVAIGSLASEGANPLTIKVLVDN